MLAGLHTRFGAGLRAASARDRPPRGHSDRVGDLVRPRTKPAATRVRVVGVDGTTVTVVPTNGRNGASSQHSGDELVVVKGFGEPIYPALAPIEAVGRVADGLRHLGETPKRRELPCPADDALPLWEGQA